MSVVLSTDERLQTLFEDVIFQRLSLWVTEVHPSEQGLGMEFASATLDGETYVLAFQDVDEFVTHTGGFGTYITMTHRLLLNFARDGHGLLVNFFLPGAISIPPSSVTTLAGFLSEESS